MLMAARVDVKDLSTAQQFVIYIFPIITNLGFINIAVVVVRLVWDEKRLKQLGMQLNDTGLITLESTD